MSEQTEKSIRSPTMPANERSQQQAEKDAIGAGNVDKIRDILFGNQMRDYERKFSRLEERIMQEVARLREESDKRLNALEGFIRQEVDALSERQKLEKADRVQSTNDLVDELKKTAKALEDKLSDLDGRLGAHTRELRQQILDQSKELSQQIGRKYEETSAAQSRIAAELRDEKVDRSALSALLTDLALRISGEPPLGSEMDE